MNVFFKSIIAIYIFFVSNQTFAGSDLSSLSCSFTLSNKPHIITEMPKGCLSNNLSEKELFILNPQLALDKAIPPSCESLGKLFLDTKIFQSKLTRLEDRVIFYEKHRICKKI